MGAVLTRRAVAVGEMVLARAAWTSAWTLVLPLTECSSCAWQAVVRGALLEEALLARGEEKAELVGEEVEEGEEVAMVGSRREGREEEGGREEEEVVVAKIEGVGPMVAREEEGSKVDCSETCIVSKIIVNIR